MKTNYNDKIRTGSFISGREWTAYNQVEVDNGTIQVGDIIVFDDPDIGYNYDQDYTTELFVGKITEIRDIDGDDGPSFLTTLPLGRLDLDSYTSIAGEGFDNVEKWDRKFINQFLSGEYEEWFSIKWRSSDGTAVRDGQ